MILQNARVSLKGGDSPPRTSSELLP